MGRQRQSRAASQLHAVSKALARERQVRAAAKEISGKIAAFQKQLEAAKSELAAIQETLDADPDLTAIARQIMEKAVARGAETSTVFIRNPSYVSAEDKRKLLLKILRDHLREHPEAAGMSFAAIKGVLRSRYSIDTASAGLFFRNELKEWKTAGGNRNKSVVLPQKQLQDQES